VRLNLPYLDTGAMYRAVALAGRRAGLAAPLDGRGREVVATLAESMDLEVSGGPRHQRVRLNGEDVTSRLRDPDVSQFASVVSAIPEVRRALVRRQRELAERTGGIVEGRDIGTVVFPDATVKVFVTAEAEVRARRRFDELAKRGATATWEEVLREQRERDRRDSARADSPMRPASDAVILDTSNLTLDQVVEALLAIVRRATER